MLLIIYDIPHDRTRTRVSDTCLDYGLERIQYSAFLGRLSRTHQEELWLRLRRILGQHDGCIQSFKLCQSCWDGRKQLGRAIAPSTITLNLTTNIIVTPTALNPIHPRRSISDEQ